MKQSRWLAVLFGLAIVAGLTLLHGADGFIAQTIRNLTFDKYQQISPRKNAPQPVRVIDIDEISLAQIGQFPWPRTEFAKLVDELNNLGAAAIVFDIIFSEPDRLSPKRILNRADLKEWLAANSQTRDTSQLPDNDLIFAKSISNAPVVLSFGRNDKGLSETPVRKSGFAFTGSATLEALHKTGKTTKLIKSLQEAASGIGSISVSPDGAQDVVRRYPLLWSQDGKAYPSLVMEALRVAQGASTFIIRGEETQSQIVESVRIGNIPISTTQHGELWMHYAPDEPDLYISAVKLLRGTLVEKTALKEKIQGHIVFIGTSATGLLDVKTTSLAKSVPGVSIHAQATQQILAQNFLWRPDWFSGIEKSLVLIIGVVIVFAAIYFSPLISFVIGIVLAVLLAGGSWFGFKNYGLLFDSSFPLASGLLVQFAMTAYRYLVTDKEARFVQMAFSRYVSPDVLREIQTDPQALELGGDTRELTIMFVDIRNFTPLSETLSPQDLVAFLNKLLGELSVCVTQEKGTIDKYIGDSIMAFWNAPLKVKDHQKHACAAALKMRATLKRLNAEDAFGFRQKNFDFAEIAIGVGINTGQACVGNLGSKERFDYSVVGDAVNVAARTESSCKELGMDILLTAPTAQSVPEFAFLDAGKIPLKGKSSDQQIFTLVGDENVRTDENFNQLSARHAELMSATTKTAIAVATKECAELATPIYSGLIQFYKKLSARRLNPTKIIPVLSGKKSSN